ncbi:MAG: hypothetical protein KDK10_07545 [Maritimibacter sp.]|nr:hypothetical protein [Maritimibacter sp.]
MATEVQEREIAIFLSGSEEPIWVLSDACVPASGDVVTIEQADGSTRNYRVLKRNWITAKQGEHMFSRVRLVVTEVTDDAATAAFGTYG